MSNGCLFLVSAPSGAGKTSLVKAALEANSKLAVSVSHTTRPIRPGETDGINYHFVSTDTFKDMIADDAFLEYATVFGNLYGTALAQLEQQLAQGYDVILEIDWQGAQLVREKIPTATSIFILPPDEATLAQRLNNRGQDSAQTIAKRLSEAQLDMSKALDFDYVVVNGDFEQAKSDLLAIFASSALKTETQLQNNPQVRALINAHKS